MPFEHSDKITFQLPAAEVDELIAGMQRSIKWHQQIISEMVSQIQHQAGQQAPQPPQPPQPNGSGRRPRPESTA